MPVCVNTATGFKYPFQQGSAEERVLYRVMGVEPNRTSKMYFDSKEEYLAWRRKSKSGYIIYTLPGNVRRDSGSENA